jgi:glycerol-3-phosphate acyltransferase PlsY
MLVNISFIIAAYLVGSISSAIVVCKLMALPDPRSQGSRNPGATNVLRYGGKKAAAITLAGDVLKGIMPVGIALMFIQDQQVLALVAIAAFLGHLYPVFFGFQGGKGVATAFGVLLPLSWLTALALVGTWLVMAGIFRISSLSALTAALLAPLYIWLFTGSMPYLIMAIVISVILFWRHRSNIRNLLSGKEGHIGSRKTGS